MSRLVITIPIPPAVCMPNRSRVHWGARQRAAKTARQQAYLSALTDSGNTRPMLDAATVHVRWYGKDKRCLAMDTTNCQGALKYALDGFTDAGIWVDDRGVRWGDIVIDVDRDRPRVELVVEEVERG